MSGTSTLPAGRKPRRLLAAVSALAAATMLVTLAQHPGTASADPQAPAARVSDLNDPRRPKTQVPQSVPGTTAPVLPPLAGKPERPLRPRRVTWPATGTAKVPVHAKGKTDGAVPAGRVGSIPVDLHAVTDTGAPAAAVVELVSTGPAAGNAAVVLRITPDATATTGSASTGKAAGRSTAIQLRVGYGSFADAVGGDWATRLRLVQLEDCTGTTPADCRKETPLTSVNDATDQAVTATLTATSAGSAIVALAAAPSGATGDYSATSLSPSSAWQAGGHTGEFSWSNPLRTPPSPGGLEPPLAFTYSSSAVDGRVASTNNQPSWVGEGHDLDTGFIERRYVPCADDMSGGINTTKTGDLCWKNDNAFLAMAGHSGEIVRDAATGTWRLKNDDGTRIEKRTGASNGDNDGEHWVLTTTDGTQYHFGVGKRSTDDTAANTNSTWTVPVFGNHTGEPCTSTTFAASHCAQAWRWNLDYVVDPNGNTMTYRYAKETNNYGRNLNTGVSSYVRGGYLTSIEYGQQQGTEHTTTAPAKVVFTVAERCLPSGTITCDPAELTAANASHWPDVPFDQICTSTTSCPTQVSPTFFSRKRLTKVTTQIWSGTAYTNVDSWTLAHQFPDPGDGTSKGLWLASITRAGHVGGTITLPATTFVGTQMPNRVDGLDTAPPLNKWRVHGINTESGASVSVNYTAQDCTPASKPASPETNTRRCFPVYFTPEGASSPSIHYFHKYLVTAVIETDRTGASLETQTHYSYGGSPAWHYDDNDLTLAKYRTYGQWRGYGTVDVRTGGLGQAQTLSRTLYLRGMDGDRLPGGGTRSVTVTDTQGGAVVDADALAGFVREQITFNGVGGAEVEGAINDPWTSAPTATNGTTSARFVDVAATRTRTALEGGAVRRTEVRTTYDSYGMPTQVNDLGDTATAADDLCTTTTYARNTSAWVMDSVATTRTVSKACTVTPTLPGDLVSDERYFYDGATSHTTAPTKGNLTRTDVVDSYTTTPVYVTQSRASYDAHGRVTGEWDALGRKTTTAYTPATGGPVTAITTTNAAGHAATSTLAPAWGEPVASVDANSRRTDATRDALGRLTQVWLPDRPKATYATTPNTKYEYVISTSAPNAVATHELENNGTYTTTWSLFDGLLRPRQTQAPAVGGGRVVTETKYDTRGWAQDVNGPFYNSSAPAKTLLVVSDGSMPSQTRTTFDGTGRPLVEAFRVNGAEKWRTTYAYGGDRVHTTPPAGGTATTEISDARGRTTELRQYTAATPTGTYDATRYTYTGAGEIKTMTDPAGNTWTNTYDLRGLITASTDPDSGTTTNTYDTAGQLTTSRDGRGSTVGYTYDSLGRRTSTRSGSATGTVLASWTYDTLAKGLVTSSTRTIGTSAYTTAVTGYDARYRPTGTSVTIPTSEGGLAGTYTTASTYNVDGGLRTFRLPVAPGLTNETLSYVYDVTGIPIRMAGNGAYVAGTIYSPFGEVLQLDMGQYIGKSVWMTRFYTEGTRRLEKQQLDRQTVATTDSDITWTYDPAGNVRSIADGKAPSGGDSQCFTYDHLRRLTAAWAQATGCASAPSLTVLGGPAKYWHSYTYDKVGNRLTQTRNATTSTGTTQVRTSTYPAPGTARPHAVTGITSNTSTGTGSFGYDGAGNTTTRTVDGKTQTLTYDVENRLASVTASAGTTSYVYDADGNRLLRKEPGKVTLYLPGTEIQLTTSTGAKASTRYYDFAGEQIAVRTATAVNIVSGDHHGTATFAVDWDTHALKTRRMHPFGETRTAASGWPGQRGFVNGTLDPSTGLTQLGVRAYDPDNGRFTTVDPILNLATPQQWNAYSYAVNNPVSFADPDGLEPRPWHAPGGFSNCAKPNQPECHPTANGGGGYSKPVGSNSRRNTSAPKRHGVIADPMRHRAGLDADDDGFITPKEASAGGYDMYNDRPCRNAGCLVGAAAYMGVVLAGIFAAPAVGSCVVSVVCVSRLYIGATDFAAGGSLTGFGVAATATGAGVSIGARTVAARTTPERASGLERTGSALTKSDPFHRSVSWVVDNPAAERFAIRGGDGVGRELYQLPGEVNGKSGVFEWIIDRSGTNPVINHQRFIPGGSITGYPNQVVR